MRVPPGSGLRSGHEADSGRVHPAESKSLATCLLDWACPEFNPARTVENAALKIRCPSNYMTLETVIRRARLLSCPTRLDVWQCVGQLGMYAGDIARTLNLAPSTVSHHLAVLEHAGLVRHVQQGRFRFYEGTGVRLGIVTEDEIAGR